MIDRHCLECLALSYEIEQLEKAVESRDVIGQAKGVVIASTGCSPEEAFSLLVQQSQRDNRKLREVATELVQSKVRRGFDRLPPTRKQKPASAPPATPARSLRLISGTD